MLKKVIKKGLFVGIVSGITGLCFVYSTGGGLFDAVVLFIVSLGAGFVIYTGIIVLIGKNI